MRGRPPKLTYPQLRQVDAWMARKEGYSRRRQVMVRIICRRLGVSADTVYAAHKRTGGYAGCPRG